LTNQIDVKERNVNRLSRRSFLTRGSLFLVLGSVATAAPGLSSILETAQVDTPELEGAASEGELAGADLSGPLVAHLTNLRSGEISFYEGERQIVYKDPGLAARLYRASR
jgi:hypothetical protein